MDNSSNVSKDVLRGLRASQVGEMGKDTDRPISDTNQAFRALVAALGYDWQTMTGKDKQDLAVRLSGMVEQVPAWSGLYVHNVYQGMQPSKKFIRAFTALEGAFAGVPLDVAAAYRVQAVSMNPAHQGVLILAQEQQCAYPPCGLWFIPRAWNQRCHCADCSAKLRKVKRGEK